LREKRYWKKITANLENSSCIRGSLLPWAWRRQYRWMLTGAILAGGRQVARRLFSRLLAPGKKHSWKTGFFREDKNRFNEFSVQGRTDLIPEVPQCFGSSSCTHEETRFATRRENLRKKNKTIVHYKKVFFSVGFSKSKNRLRRKNLKNRLRRRGPKKREKKTGGVWPVFFIGEKKTFTISREDGLWTGSFLGS